MSSSVRGIAATPLHDGLPALAFAGGGEHLLLEFERLRFMLSREVLRLRASHLLNENEFRGLYISDEQVDAILQSRQPGPDNLRPQTPALDTQQLALQVQYFEQVIASRVQSSLAQNIVLPLVELARRFDLSPQEQDTLLICAAPEIDLRFETLYSYTQNDVTRKRPTADLVLRLLFENQEERMENRALFSSEGKLIRGALIRFAEEPQSRDSSFLARPLWVDDRIVEFLLGRSGLDARIRPFTSCVEPVRTLSELHFPKRLAADLQSAALQTAKSRAVLVFLGPRGSGKRSAAEGFSRVAGRPLLVIDLRRALAATTNVVTSLSLLCREAILRGANLFLAHAESLPGDDPQLRQQCLPFQESLSSFPFTVFLGTDSPWPNSDAPLSRSVWSTFEFPIPAASDRVRLWSETMLRIGATPVSGTDLPLLANRFALTGGEIESACRLAKTYASLRDGELAPPSTEDLHCAARSASSHGLRKLAQKVETVHGWSDLVLPPRHLQQLREVCSAEKYRHVIYCEWGFDQRMAQGKGLNVLFSGASGTGKTMSAGIIARELSLDLYKIDLSTVVSKYIGETEKHLSLIFREAASSNAILFFDEADALFGKRSEVKDAHDRFANIEVSYLLQKMEEYQGIVILATNFRKNIDEAFTRRIHYIIDFPFPSVEYREKIWRGLIPARAPLADDVDFAFLARQFELAGGNIRNVVLSAAFLAADQKSSIHMEHFIRATSRELQKLGKLASRTEFREFYDLTRDPM